MALVTSFNTENSRYLYRTYCRHEVCSSRAWWANGQDWNADFRPTDEGWCLEADNMVLVRWHCDYRCALFHLQMDYESCTHHQHGYHHRQDQQQQQQLYLFPLLLLAK